MSSPLPDEEKPIRIIVEVVSAADVARLEARDEDVRAELKQLERKLEGLHRTLYEVIDTISKVRNRK